MTVLVCRRTAGTTRAAADDIVAVLNSVIYEKFRCSRSFRKLREVFNGFELGKVIALRM